jgi:hypothetical protein
MNFSSKNKVLQKALKLIRKASPSEKFEEELKSVYRECV